MAGLSRNDDRGGQWTGGAERERGALSWGLSDAEVDVMAARPHGPDRCNQ
jgi:hypothetical protein